MRKTELRAPSDQIGRRSELMYYHILSTGTCLTENDLKIPLHPEPPFPGIVGTFDLAGKR